MASLKVPASVPPPYDDAEQLHKAFEGDPLHDESILSFRYFFFVEILCGFL
jgi:annexin A7/11